MDAPITVDLGGRTVAVAIRRSAQARRLSLRLDPIAGPVLTLPIRVRNDEAARFLFAHRLWLAERLARQPARIALAPGIRVPVLDRPREIRHVPTARRGTWLEEDYLCVSGLPDHVARRVTDFLKAEAGRRIRPEAAALAARIGRPLGRVSLRDTRSRWGSCSPRGDLSFCWRLVMAPERVVSYVVAHEIAHLVEMNHGPGFWGLVGELAGDIEPARRWLKTHGSGLHLYG
jgi:predicted metal-dependent hydrolase